MLQTIPAAGATATRNRALAVAAVLMLLALPYERSTAGPAVVNFARPSQSAAAPAGSSSVCLPAGFVRATEVGSGTLGSVLRNGETHYCVVSNLSWSKTSCAKYLPAEEYIRHKIGRPDAVYSGMALDPTAHSNIVLFYCLPPRKQ